MRIFFHFAKTLYVRIEKQNTIEACPQACDAQPHPCTSVHPLSGKAHEEN